MPELQSISSQTNLNSLINQNSTGFGGQNTPDSQLQFDPNNRFSSFPNLQGPSIPSIQTSGTSLTTVQQGQLMSEQFNGLPDSVRNPGPLGTVSYQTGNNGRGSLTATPTNNGAGGSVTNTVTQGTGTVTAGVTVDAPNARGQQVTNGSVGISSTYQTGVGISGSAGASVNSATGVGVNATANIPGGIVATASGSNLNGNPTVTATVRQQPTRQSVFAEVGVSSTPTGTSATAQVGNIPFFGGTLGINGSVGTNNGQPVSSGDIRAEFRF